MQAAAAMIVIPTAMIMIPALCLVIIRFLKCRELVGRVPVGWVASVMVVASMAPPSCSNGIKSQLSRKLLQLVDCSGGSWIILVGCNVAAGSILVQGRGVVR